jgi:hypothetical protein
MRVTADNQTVIEKQRAGCRRKMNVYLELGEREVDKL